MIAIVVILMQLEAPTLTAAIHSPRDVGLLYMRCIQSRDFECASSRFHFGSHHSDQERARDERAIPVALRLMTDFFGEIVSSKQITAPDEYFVVSFGSGNLSTTDEKKVVISVSFKARTTLHTDVLVRVNTVRSTQGWEIAHVEYGLPTKDPEAQTRLAGFAKLLHHTLTELD